MPSRNYLDWSHWDGKACPLWVALFSRLSFWTILKGQSGWSTCVHLSVFLTVGAMRPAASNCYSHAPPPWWTGTSNCSQNKTLPYLSCLFQDNLRKQQERERGHIIFCALRMRKLKCERHLTQDQVLIHTIDYVWTWTIDLNPVWDPMFSTQLMSILNGSLWQGSQPNQAELKVKD